nr:MAG TPA: hypothetical protein [Caudoviricetes sp.]
MDSKFQLRLNQKPKIKTLKNTKQRKEGEIWQNR